MLKLIYRFHQKVLPETNLKQQSEEAAANAAITGGSAALDKIKVSMTTWLFEPESFAPLAKQVNGKTFGIITDHLGTPLSMHDVEGRTIWSAELNCYGQIENLVGKAKDCPFRYPGQYEDVETGLYYNRFRYYSPEEGMYISQDPIGLEGGEITLYSYVSDPNILLDNIGLAPTSTKTKLPNKVIYNENKIRIWHNFGNEGALPGTLKDHGPVHFHSSYKGKEYRSFPSGKHLNDSEQLPEPILNIFKQNKSRYMRIGKRIGKWFKNISEGGKCGKQ